MSWRVHRRLGCSQRLPLTGAGTRAFGSFELLDFAGGSAHQLVRRQFTCTCSIVRSLLPPASGARFDLASHDADVLQRAVIEPVKRPDGARHRPFFAGFADDAPERFAGSSPHAGTNACFVDRLSREARASPLEAGLERGVISSGGSLEISKNQEIVAPPRPSSIGIRPLTGGRSDRGEMIFRFGAYEVDELRRGSTVVPVEPRTVDVLAYLLKNSDPGSSTGTALRIRQEPPTAVSGS